MSSSELSTAPSAMLRSLLTDLPVFRIVLRDAKRYDTYETREFDLPLNAEFPIGRASSNAAKRELMAAPHNAYIDSPVISRQHAVLTASSNSGVPEVYITDKGSMHGTILNSQRLPANTPTKLNNGDVLQFGTDVNRNEGTSARRPSRHPLARVSKLTAPDTEFFVARTYTFESQLSRPFSLGFTVPDPETDEEEVTERRGSQVDPFVIEDDSDAADDQSDAGDQEDVTLIMDQVLHQSEPAQPLSLGQDEFPESAMRSTVVNQDHNQESFPSHRDDSLVPASPNLSSDGEDIDALGTDSDSEAGSIDSSEAMSDSEPEIPDSDDDDMDETKQNKSVTSPSNKENEASVSSQAPPAVRCHMSMQHPSTVSFRDVYTSHDVANTQPSLPRMYMFGMQSSDNSMSTSSMYGDNAPPPLPPRPSASRAAPWCDSSYRPFAQQNDLQDWYSEGMTQPNYLGSNFGDRPSLFSQAPPPPAPESIEARAPMSHFGSYPSQNFQASRLQTPPPMPASDVDTSTPLQPGRRTKVSIEEIVEEQPPTPESVNNLKRKADVLEAEEPAELQVETPMVTMVEEHVSSDSAAAVTVTDAAAIQTAAIIAQRPKKTPRSVLSKVLNKAAYPLLGATGAVVSFALLSTLPDAFFV
jgi:pSer/pThr/pTyr-binding forkhead associated (FHA) protein